MTPRRAIAVTKYTVATVSLCIGWIVLKPAASLPECLAAGVFCLLGLALLRD